MRKFKFPFHILNKVIRVYINLYHNITNIPHSINHINIARTHHLISSNTHRRPPTHEIPIKLLLILIALSRAAELSRNILSKSRACIWRDAARSKPKAQQPIKRSKFAFSASIHRLYHFCTGAGDEIQTLSRAGV